MNAAKEEKSTLSAGRL